MRAKLFGKIKLAVRNPRGFYNPLYTYSADEAWGVHATNDGGCVTSFRLWEVCWFGDEYEEWCFCIGNVCSDIWNAYIIKYDSDGLITGRNDFFTS